MLGARRVPGGCAVPVPVSAEIEMKENFLSQCPSYESMRERKREKEREKDFPRGSAVIKGLCFEKQREKRSVSNPHREERENIPLLRAGRGLEGPWCGGSSPVLLPGAEESSGQEQREI